MKKFNSVQDLMDYLQTNYGLDRKESAYVVNTSGLRGYFNMGMNDDISILSFDVYDNLYDYLTTLMPEVVAKFLLRYANNEEKFMSEFTDYLLYDADSNDIVAPIYYKPSGKIIEFDYVIG